MIYFKILHQSLLGAVLALAFSLSHGAQAHGIGEDEVFCREILHHQVCNFIDKFGRRCTIAYGRTTELNCLPATLPAAPTPEYD